MISKRDVQLGKIALQEEMVSKEQINKCLKIKKKLNTKASLGAILVKKGYITKDQLERIVSIHNARTKDDASQDDAVATSTESFDISAATSQDTTEDEPEASSKAVKPASKDKDKDKDKDKSKSVRSETATSKRRATGRQDAPSTRSTKRLDAAVAADSGEKDRSESKTSASTEARRKSRKTASLKAGTSAEKGSEKSAEKPKDKDKDKASERDESGKPKKRSATARHGSAAKGDDEAGRSASSKAKAREAKGVDDGGVAGILESGGPGAEDEVDPSILMSADSGDTTEDIDGSSAGTQDGGVLEANVMEQLLASTLEGAPETEDDSSTSIPSESSDALIESADFTETAEEVDSKGRIKKKIIACKDCGKKYRLKPKQAGKRFNCRRCGTKVRVPKDYFEDVDEAIKTVPKKQTSRKATGKVAKPPKDDAGGVEEFDLDEFGDEDEADSKPKKPAKSRKASARKPKGEEKISPVSYADLAKEAMKAGPTEIRQRRLTTANIIQIVVLSVVLIGSVGGFFAWQNYQEQQRIAALEKARKDEWDLFKEQYDALVKKARSEFNEVKKASESPGNSERLTRSEDQLKKIDILIDALSFPSNDREARAAFKADEVSRLRVELLYEAAHQLEVANSIEMVNQAIALYTRGVELATKKPDLHSLAARGWVRLGLAQSRNHSWDAAFLAAQRALEFDKESKGALALRGVTYERGDSAAEAKDAYEQLARIDPLAAALQARALVRADDHVGATKALEDAIKEVQAAPDAAGGSGEQGPGGGSDKPQDGAQEGAAAESLSKERRLAILKLALGRCLESKDDFAGAERHYQDAASQDPGFAWPHLYLGELQLEQNQASAAQVSYRKALELGAGAPAHLGTARAALRSFDLDAAVNSFRQAATTPENPVSVGPRIESVPILTPALDYADPRSTARIELGDLFRAQGRDREAASEYELARQLDPWNPVAHARVARAALEFDNDATGAESALRLARLLSQSIKGGNRLSYEGVELIRSAATAQVFEVQGLLATSQGQLSNAEGALTLALKIEARSPSLLIAMANLLLRLNQKPNAYKRMDEAAKVEISDSLVVQCQSLVQEAVDKKDDKASLERALRASIALEARSLVSPAAWHFRALVYAAQGKKELALKAFETSANLNPRRLVTRRDRALYMIREKLDYALALSDIDALIENESGAELYIAKTLCLLRLNRVDAALLAINDAIGREPSRKESYALRAECYDRLNRPADAAKDRKKAE